MTKPGRPIEIPRELVIRAATTLIEREGRASFSLRNLADEMGRTTSVVYTHFGSAEEVLDAVAARYVEEAEFPPMGDDPLGDVERIVIADFRRALEHPDLASLVVERRPVTASATKAADHLDDRLRAGGVDADRVATVVSTLGLHTLGAFASLRLGPTPGLLRRFEENVRLILKGARAG